LEGKEAVRVASVCPGRIRLRFRPEKADIPNLADFLNIEGVEEVSFNKNTKSLLILHDEKVPTEKVLDEMGKIPYLELQKGEPELNDPPLTDDALSSMVYQFGEKLNERVRDGTKGHADLASLAPSLLFLVGAVEMFRKPVMPRWYDLWWYALNMYYWGYRDTQRPDRGPMSG
jgi:hypothetical protein